MPRSPNLFSPLKNFLVTPNQHRHKGARGLHFLARTPRHCEAVGRGRVADTTIQREREARGESAASCAFWGDVKKPKNKNGSFKTSGVCVSQGARREPAAHAPQASLGVRVNRQPPRSYSAPYPPKAPRPPLKPAHAPNTPNFLFLPLLPIQRHNAHLSANLSRAVHPLFFIPTLFLPALSSWNPQAPLPPLSLTRTPNVRRRGGTQHHPLNAPEPRVSSSR